MDFRIENRGLNFIAVRSHPAGNCVFLFGMKRLLIALEHCYHGKRKTKKSSEKRKERIKNLKEQWINAPQATLEKIELDQKKNPLFMEKRRERKDLEKVYHSEAAGEKRTK